MATVISLCANLKEINSVEFLKQNKPIQINNKDSLLKCNQEKHFFDESYQATSLNPDRHNLDVEHTKHKNLINDWLSNFQCDDLLCKISYTTLVLSDEVFMTLDRQIIILPLISGFISHTPKKLYRPPVV